MGSKFSPEFKKQLVGEVVDNSRTVASVAREYGIGAETLRLWVKNHRKAQSEAAPASAARENEEVARLRKENQELKAERDFLKKAAAFFAKEYR